jgi:hypothetical protein
MPGTSKRTEQRHMSDAGYIPARGRWLTQEQFKKVTAWDAQNRADAQQQRKEKRTTKEN